jgi:hypothetical protein
MLIVFRLIAGTFGSSPLSNAGGSLADIWLVCPQTSTADNSLINVEKQWLFSQLHHSLAQ